MLEHVKTNSNKTVQRAFVRRFSKKSPTAKQIRSWQKNSKTKTVCRAKGSGRPAPSEKSSSRFAKHSCEAPKSPLEEQSENPDSTNDKLAGSKETLGNETPQTAAHSGHDGK